MAFAEQQSDTTNPGRSSAVLLSTCRHNKGQKLSTEVSGDSRRDSALLTEPCAAITQGSRRSSPSFSIRFIATCAELPGERSSSGLSDMIDGATILQSEIKANRLLYVKLNKWKKKRRKSAVFSDAHCSEICDLNSKLAHQIHTGITQGISK